MPMPDVHVIPDFGNNHATILRKDGEWYQHTNRALFGPEGHQWTPIESTIWSALFAEFTKEMEAQGLPIDEGYWELDQTDEDFSIAYHEDWKAACVGYHRGGE